MKNQKPFLIFWALLGRKKMVLLELMWRYFFFFFFHILYFSIFNNFNCLYCRVVNLAQKIQPKPQQQRILFKLPPLKMMIVWKSTNKCLRLRNYNVYFIIRFIFKLCTNKLFYFFIYL